MVDKPTRHSLGFASGKMIEFSDGTAAYVKSMEFTQTFRVHIADVTGFAVSRNGKMLERRLTILGNGTTLATVDVPHGTSELIEKWFRGHKLFRGNLARGGPAPAPPTPPVPPPRSLPNDTLHLVADELRKLADLRNEGILSDGEFAAQKAKLFGSDPVKEEYRPLPPLRTQTMTSVAIGIGWEADLASGRQHILEVSALACGDDARVLDDNYFVFRENASSPDASIVLISNGGSGGDRRTIVIDLVATHPAITRIFVAVSITDADSCQQNFGQVRSAYVRVADRNAGSELARYDLSEDAALESALVFGELYRRDREWKFRAVGQGYSSGEMGIARHYGANV